MWIYLIFLKLFAVIAADGKVLRKCCPIKETLKKTTDSDFNIEYECINETINQSSLIISKGFELIYGFPDFCNKSNLNETGNIKLGADNDQCIEVITTEVFNGTLNIISPRPVGLSCKPFPVISSNEVKHVNKCCPKNQSYDVYNHLCRQNAKTDDEEKLIQNVTIGDNYVYIFENNFTQMKPDQFALELTTDFFTLALIGNTLRVSKINYDSDITEFHNDWCIDHEYSNGKTLARVFTNDCAKFGALCIKKCCKVGEHYRPRRANTTISDCVSNNNDKQLLDMSYYLQTLKKKDSFEGKIYCICKIVHILKFRYNIIYCFVSDFIYYNR